MPKPIIRGIAIDLDGTFLDSNGRVSSANESALHRALNHGLMVCFASGKLFEAVNPHVQRFNLVTPQITLNGGVLVDPHSRAILHRECFSHDDLQILMQELMREQVVFAVYTAMRSYAVEDSPLFRHMEHLGESWPMLRSSFADLDPVVKVATFTSASQLMREESLRRLSERFHGRLRAVRTSPTLFEFIPTTSGKGNALRRITDLLGLKPEEMAAIGDSENDIGMLEVVGLPLAMGNAVSGLKDKAEYIVADNNSSGVAEALELILSTRAGLSDHMKMPTG